MRYGASSPQLVYRIARCDGNFADVPGDAELVNLDGGSITSSYTSRVSVVTVLHEMASPYCADEGVAILQSQIFWLASDSCTNTGARNKELMSPAPSALVWSRQNTWLAKS